MRLKLTACPTLQISCSRSLITHFGTQKRPAASARQRCFLLNGRDPSEHPKYPQPFNEHLLGQWQRALGNPPVTTSQGQLPWAPLGHRRHLEPLSSRPSLPHAALLQQEFSHTCTRASRFRRSTSRLAPMLLLRPLLVRGRDRETWLTGLFCSRRSPLGTTESHAGNNVLHKAPKPEL